MYTHIHIYNIYIYIYIHYTQPAPGLLGDLLSRVVLGVLDRAQELASRTATEFELLGKLQAK